MLLRFSVQNFLSFRDRQTLDLTAAKSCKERLENNTVESGSLRILKNAVIYGANASGKSNLFLAMGRLRDLVINSSKESQAEELIAVTPFLLRQDTANAPTSFEVELELAAGRFRYGVEFDTKKIHREWLFRNGRAQFLRDNRDEEDSIQIEAPWSKARGLETRTRKNSLFLSVCAQFALPQAEELVRWFVEDFQVISGLWLSPQQTTEQLQQRLGRAGIIQFLRNADTQIQDFKITNLELNALPRGAAYGPKVLAVHHVYDGEGNVISSVALPLDCESEGTRKVFALAGPLMSALQRGSVLVVDELDSKLHPILTRQIVRMFNSREFNPNRAQLILNTHDTNLLSFKTRINGAGDEETLLRRDQIFFTEKDGGEGTQLYSLIEFKKEGRKVRNDASYEKDYLNGLYGAIPFIGNLNFEERHHE